MSERYRAALNFVALTANYGMLDSPKVACTGTIVLIDNGTAIANAVCYRQTTNLRIG